MKCIGPDSEIGKILCKIGWCLDDDNPMNIWATSALCISNERLDDGCLDLNNGCGSGSRLGAA